MNVHRCQTRGCRPLQHIQVRGTMHVHDWPSGLGLQVSRYSPAVEVVTGGLMGPVEALKVRDGEYYVWTVGTLSQRAQNGPKSAYAESRSRFNMILRIRLIRKGRDS